MKGEDAMGRFEFDGVKYRGASTHQKEWGLDLIGDLEIGGDERILDLGCGDGTLTEQLASLVPAGEVIGLDASEGMIRAAKELEGGNLRFELMDIDALDYQGEFDLIFSNAALHWVGDHARLLTNCHRALDLGGAIRFNFAADGNCAHFFRVVRAVMAYPRFEKYFRDFAWPWFMPTLEAYVDLLGGCGFADFQVKGENKDRHFPDTETMIRWIDQPSLVPFAREVAEKDWCAFRCNVISEMIDLTMQKDGTCFETFRRIDVFARKCGASN